MLTIFVTNYWQLFTLRILTGIAGGGGWVGGCRRCYLLPASRLLGYCRQGWPPLSHSAVPSSFSRLLFAGALPVVFSLLGDLYDPSRRAGVSSIVQLSTGIGLAAGQGIAGFVGALD